MLEQDVKSLPIEKNYIITSYKKYCSSNKALVKGTELMLLLMFETN
jgi:hypothetical protein